jgi:hypothetical protein
MSEGYIYILSNPSFKKDLLKIGKTTRSPQDRLTELSNVSGVPSKYNLEFVEFVPDCHHAEYLLHQKLDDYREGKEFFKAPLDIAISEARNIADIIRRSDHTHQTGNQQELVLDERKNLNESGTNLDQNEELEVNAIIDNSAFQPFYTLRRVVSCANCNKEYSVTFKRHEKKSVCPYCHTPTDNIIYWSKKMERKRERT